MESYIHNIPLSNQVKAKEDIELVRKTVQDFYLNQIMESNHH